MNPARFPLVSSYANRGNVFTTGFCIAPNGYDLLTTRCRVHPNSPRFGIERGAAMNAHRLLKLGENLDVKFQAEAVVRRARLGDQNAMAVIAVTRDAAKNGDPRARMTVQVMEDYIRRNPAQPGPSFGADKKQADTLAIRLANGSALSNPRIGFIMKNLPSPHRDPFMYGFQKWRSEHESEHRKLNARIDEIERALLSIGRTIGKARAIQMVRLPGADLRKFNPALMELY